ncbi:hypothetical protein CYMTET_20898 [Cymbomonas tetramitiformis]|uniref:Uncharacterized protein n=1 Tax=Cymbomonas tetramitiformis TaxID=36881 RepID=A0AAE0G366_9CHLO|nr:hypothetical protein CYMTET_20898 [Cymbomonas tetramitiformis]
MPNNDKQKNKSHKAGRKAGLSRRHKFKESSEVRRKPGFKALGSQDLRGDRLNKAKQARDAARRNILEEKRSAREHGPPKIVGLMALSDSVDLSITARWLSEACTDGTEGSGGMDTEDSLTSKLASGAPLTMLSLKHKVRFTLLAPPRADLAANLVRAPQAPYLT